MPEYRKSVARPGYVEFYSQPSIEAVPAAATLQFSHRKSTRGPDEAVNPLGKCYPQRHKF